jgi:hypothetical protein
MTGAFSEYHRPTHPDPRLLPVRDRAILLILNRCKAATCSQLAELTRSHPRKIQQRTRHLWEAGYIERRPIPAGPIGSWPNAHRLTRNARGRLGYTDRRVAGINELQHRIDTVDAVAALARPHDGAEYPMQAWLTESMSDGLLGPTPWPDSVVVIQTHAGSAVLCLETDEATQHSPVIERKLAAYREALASRPGWWVLFVVPTTARLRWLQRRAVGIPELKGWQSGLATELVRLRLAGLAAAAKTISRDHDECELALLAADPTARRCPTPIGTREWLELLASGGGEDLGKALR